MGSGRRLELVLKKFHFNYSVLWLLLGALGSVWVLLTTFGNFWNRLVCVAIGRFSFFGTSFCFPPPCHISSKACGRPACRRCRRSAFGLRKEKTQNKPGENSKHRPKTSKKNMENPPTCRRVREVYYAFSSSSSRYTTRFRLAVAHACTTRFRCRVSRVARVSLEEKGRDEKRREEQRRQAKRREEERREE